MSRKSGAGVALALGAIVGAFVIAGGGKKRRSGGTKPNGGNGKEPPACAAGGVCAPGQVCIGGYCIDEEKARCPEGTEPVVSPATGEVVCRPGGKGPKKKKPTSGPKRKKWGAVVSRDCSSAGFEDGSGDKFWSIVTGKMKGSTGVGDLIGEIIERGYGQPMDVVQQLMVAMTSNSSFKLDCFTPQTFPAAEAGDRLSIERQRLLFMRQNPQVYSWFAEIANRVDLDYFNGRRWLGVNNRYVITRFGADADATLEPIIAAATAMVARGDRPGLDFATRNMVSSKLAFSNWESEWNWDIDFITDQWWFALNAGGAAMDAMAPGLGRFFIERTPKRFEGKVVIGAIDPNYTDRDIQNRMDFDKVAGIADYEAYLTAVSRQELNA